MENRMPRAKAGLFSFAGNTAEGLHSLRATLTVTYSTETVVLQVLENALTADADYQAAKSASLRATADLTRTKKKVAIFLTLMRDMLKPVLGSRYSEKWCEVGYVNATLMLPATQELLLSLLKSAELYLAAHPEREAAGLATRQIAADLYQEYLARISAANSARSAQRRKRAACDQAVETLTQRMRMLYGELKLLLAKDDPRWLQLGFNVPADKSSAKATEMETETGKTMEMAETPTSENTAIAIANENAAMPKDVNEDVAANAVLPDVPT